MDHISLMITLIIDHELLMMLIIIIHIYICISRFLLITIIIVNNH